jgi:hypothetical protein
MSARSRRLVPMPTRRAARPEPVLVEHEPVVNHPLHAWHHTVPYPYRFKWDGPWLFVLFLFAGGFAFSPLWLLAPFIACLRCLVWLCFRFPLTMMFFTAFISGLFGGRRRRW